MRRQMRYDVAVVIDTEWLQDNSGSIDYLEWIDYLRPEKASVFPLFAASYIGTRVQDVDPNKSMMLQYFFQFSPNSGADEAEQKISLQHAMHGPSSRRPSGCRTS